MTHKHTNLLINESSPYLLQHAHNPVQWRPWGHEALDAAQREDKPIIVSIGYAACHWCHVMERESFENEETAKLMNENFINIKIDREERPDIDHIYMDAVQAMTGSGGWPLNVFLMPDGKPFFGGTYFPPVSAHNRNSWTEILNAVKDAYSKRKTELESQAENLTEYLKNSSTFQSNNSNDETLFSRNSIEIITGNLMKNADKVWGGFGGAPKFPQTFSIQYLLRNYYFTKNEESLKQALLSLDKMINGGIYDHLAGGIARYSTDETWFAPHFEKMLYDNALLINVLAEAYQLTKLERFKEKLEETLGFVKRELTDTNGAFYSAIDADSEGLEGKYYTWTKSEIETILDEDAAIFCEFFGVLEEGNWESTNILHVKTSLVQFAEEKKLNYNLVQEKISESKAKLLYHREKRTRPILDDKIILGWNALMIIAYCKAYAATGIQEYKLLAVKNIDFLEKFLCNAATLQWYHTYKDGIAKYPAFLDDYAFLISAYIHLQEVTGNEKYLTNAKALTIHVMEHFSDNDSGIFYYTGITQQDLILRKKEIYDGAIPSGNAILANNFHYLSIIFNIEEWKNYSIKMLKNVINNTIKYPSSFGNWACLYQELVLGVPEIIMTGKFMDNNLKELLFQYIPGRILQVSKVHKVGFPLLDSKSFSDDKLIYVCKNNTCYKPVNTVEEIKTLLK